MILDDVAPLRHTVHLGCTVACAALLEADAEAAAFTIVHIDCIGIEDLDGLVGRIANLFVVPFPIRGLDAVVSVLADLGWLAVSPSLLLVVHGLDRVSTEVADAVLGIMPSVMDRRQAGGGNMVVVSTGRQHATRGGKTLRGQNERGLLGSQTPWGGGFRPVRIIDHTAERADNGERE